MKNAISVGDVAFCSIISSIIAFIPSKNVFSSSLNINPSIYDYIKIINYYTDYKNLFQTFKFNICDDGCSVVRMNGDIFCKHQSNKKRYFYYMPVRDRIEFLLNSDLRNLFLYPNYKYKSPKVSSFS